ncbi:MAG: BRO-N domain protein [Hyperionvirus sp.]|uniref:BRO-N domain protein n=1 Tax=Hyperionvirus sp. TaxID=2487770 RepID=A0A3G5A784_9VIRU|nr:MAG: BRO-N domain protein [Hyperionvirus sp.]
MSNLIDLFNNILKYDDQEITVLMNVDGEPWFSGGQIAKILGYQDTASAVSTHVDSTNKAYYDDIKYDLIGIKQKIHRQTVFINETGLYEFLNNSEMPKAKEFRKWIEESVAPSIRKTGSYFLAEKYREELQKIKGKLAESRRRVRILLHNQKKTKYPKGGTIYIMRPIDAKNKFVKIGISENFLPRINTYNSTVPDNVKILYSITLQNVKAIEYCMKGDLYKYRYRKNKEYYVCTIRRAIESINKCNKLVNNIDEPVVPLDNLNRLLATDPDYDEAILFGLSFVRDVPLNPHEEEEEAKEADENECFCIQSGGLFANSYEYKFYKYKLKYLEERLKRSYFGIS